MDKAWLDRIQEVVDWALDAGLYVVINSHHDRPDYWIHDDRGHFVTPLKSRDHNSVKTTLATIWRQVSERFKDYPETLMFETMNEPAPVVNNGKVWIDAPDHEYVSKLNAEILATIRKSGGNNDKRIVVAPVWLANYRNAEHYYNPDDKYTMCDVHFYYDEQYDANGYKEIAEILDKQLLSRKIPVLIGECVPINAAGGVDGPSLSVAKVLYPSLTKLNIPTAWWSGGDEDGGMALMVRKFLKWRYNDILDVMFKAYNVRQGANYEYKLFPYNLSLPTHKDWAWYDSREIVNALEEDSSNVKRFVVEGDFSDDILAWGFKFGWVANDVATEFDQNSKLVTVTKNKITLDASSLKLKDVDIIGFAFWNPEGYKSITRIYLDGAAK